MLALTCTAAVDNNLDPWTVCIAASVVVVAVHDKKRLLDGHWQGGSTFNSSTCNCISQYAVAALVHTDQTERMLPNIKRATGASSHKQCAHAELLHEETILHYNVGGI